MKKLFLIVFMSLYFWQINAQNTTELIKKRQTELKVQKEKQEKAIRGYKADFESYISAEDQKFSEFLKNRWSEFQIFTGREIPARSKPTIPPVFIPDSSIDRLEPIELTVGTELLLVEAPVLKPLSKKLYPREPGRNVYNRIVVCEFDFFGSDIIIGMDPTFTSGFEKVPGEIAFSEFWTKAARADYPYVINQLIKYSNTMKLNDWAYYMLVDKLSKQIHPDDDNSKELLTWFILVKSGYNAKIGYDATKIYLMLACGQQIYQYAYISLDGVNYYLPKSMSSTLFTYNKSFGEAGKGFNVNLVESPSFSNETKTRDLSFDYQDNKYSLSVAYEPDLITFYNEYPVVDFTNYFNASVSEITQKSMTEQLNPILDNRTELEKVEILLGFTQQAFPYKTDEEQFGREKYFFVEDIFSYPYSDCEDRAVLFSYLVGKLVRLKTLGLKTTGHVFTAVELENVQGDYVDYKGRHYFVCDPTYMGASVGLGMPSVMKKEISIIPINQ